MTDEKILTESDDEIAQEKFRGVKGQNDRDGF